MSNPISQTPLSTATLSKALQSQIEDLIRQFATLVNLASDNPTESSEPGSPSNLADEPNSTNSTSVLPSAAVQSFRITAGTQALITNAENLAALTRRLKEACLFGELETVGASDAVRIRTEGVARVVVEDVLTNSKLDEGGS